MDYNNEFDIRKGKEWREKRCMIVDFPKEPRHKGYQTPVQYRENNLKKVMLGENEETDKIIIFVNAKTIGRECTSEQILRLDEMRKRLMERRLHQ